MDVFWFPPLFFNSNDLVLSSNWNHHFFSGCFGYQVYMQISLGFNHVLIPRPKSSPSALSSIFSPKRDQKASASWLSKMRARAIFFGGLFPLCCNPFSKWFWSGFWVPKHLLYNRAFGALGFFLCKKIRHINESSKRTKRNLRKKNQW